MCIVCLPKCPVLYLKKVLGPKRCIFWYECWCQWRLIWNYSSANINPTWGNMLVMCNLMRNVLYFRRGHRPPVAMLLSFSDCVLVQVWCGSTTIYGQLPSGVVMKFHHYLWPVPALIRHSLSLVCISQSITIHTVAMSTMYGQTPSAVVVLTHYSILLHYWLYHLPLCSTELMVTTSLREEKLHSGRL